MQATAVHQQQQQSSTVQRSNVTSNVPVTQSPNPTTTTKVYKVLPTNIAAIKSHSSTSVGTGAGKVQVINATNVHQHSNSNPSTPNVLQTQHSNSSDLLE